MRWARRIVIALVVALALVVVMVVFAVGRYVLEPRVPTPDYGLSELISDEMTVSYRGSATDLRIPGIIGLTWPGGFARLSPPIETAGTVVTREVVIASTPVPPCMAEECLLYDLNGWASGEVPSDRGFEFEEVGGKEANGSFGAWQIVPEREAETWVIVIHGSGADRREGLRYLDVFQEAGVAALLISYRNDASRPRDESGRNNYGLTEWGDLEAAVEYATDRGASCVIPYGISTGAAVALSFMKRSHSTDQVCGLIFDSANLDVRSSVKHSMQGAVPWVPGSLFDVGLWFSQVWYGFSWSSWDRLNGSTTYDVPILLLHGVEDSIVPIESSRQFVDSHETAKLLEFDDAGHGLSWNVDRSRYEMSLEAFLADVSP